MTYDIHIPVTLGVRVCVHVRVLVLVLVRVRICIHMYIYRRLGGASPACPTHPNREIDFDFDFDSFVGAGEAKLCGRVRDASSTLGLGFSKTAGLRGLW